jgi:type I restriction enzyme S subunit
VPWFTLADVWQIRELGADYIYETKEKVSVLGLENSSARILPKGTVMLSRTASVGFSAIMGVDMATTQDFANWVCGPRLVPKFLLQVLRSMQAEFDRMKMGSTHNTIYMPDIQALQFALPPQDEQEAIVETLARETAKINTLVAEQQRLVDLLKEKRQAVISHAITKGLNSDAPMKPSGVDWLGDVPAHWEVCPVSSRFEVQLGKMLDSAKLSGEHLRPYLRVFDVQWGRINTVDLPQMDFDADARAKFALRPGDLLVNEGGSYPGRSAVWLGTLRECYYQKALHRLRAHKHHQASTEFFYFVMERAVTQGVFVAGGNEATIEHLPAEKLRRYRFGFPPIEEQCAIVTYLTSETQKLDKLTAEAERAINLLQERRTALVRAAVTGQIDVRSLAAAEVA